MPRGHKLQFLFRGLYEPAGQSAAKIRVRKVEKVKLILLVFSLQSDLRGQNTERLRGISLRTPVFPYPASKGFFTGMVLRIQGVVRVADICVVL